MNSTLLLTRPNHDIGTNYLCYWSELAVKETRGFKILDLMGEKANRVNFTSYVLKHKPAIIFMNGHGSEDVICGQDNEIIVERNKNEYLLKNSVVYARSCDAGKRLGLDCVKKGTLAFIGYKRKYILGFSTQYITRPIADPVAKLFLEPSNLIIKSLLKGNTVRKALQKSKEEMLRNIRFMLSDSALMEQRDAAPYLWANINSQVEIGDLDIEI